ncbi:MAG: type II toxin-antitoxin system Phd/YefM family antitoxin [Rhizomicrobium sp.]
MTDSINVAEAKAHFSELLDRAARGEEIVVARAGKPVARIMPLASPPKRPFGIAKHWKIPPDDVLLEPMSEDDLRWAEGYYQTKDGLYTRATLRKLANQDKSRKRRKS